MNDSPKHLISERGRALIIASTVLDRSDVDPDSDLAVLARQLTRAQEELERKIRGVCTECGLKTDGWQPAFGSFAPEWWATMREGGIDPATGHASTCSKAKGT
jgi:hypothetical protein